MTSGDLAFANQARQRRWPHDTIDKLVAMNQQQARIIANLTEAFAKLKNCSPLMEQ
jgi:hypothetical protein